MATGKRFPKTAVAFVVFLLIWFVGIGLLYAQFQVSPVKQMSVRDGAVIGEMGFVEARAAACTFTMILFILLVVFLVRASKPGQRGVSGPESGGQSASSSTSEDWYPDPTTRHELRYWNGTTWTEHVSDAGVAAVNPPGAWSPSNQDAGKRHFGHVAQGRGINMKGFFGFRPRARVARDEMVGLLPVLLLAFSVLASGCSSGAPDVSGTWEFRDSEGGGMLFMPNEDGPTTEGVVAVFDRDLGLPIGYGLTYYVLEGDTITMGNDLVWKIEVSGDVMTATDVSNGESGDSYELERTKPYPE